MLFVLVFSIFFLEIIINTLFPRISTLILGSAFRFTGSPVIGIAVGRIVKNYFLASTIYFIADSYHFEDAGSFIFVLFYLVSLAVEWISIQVNSALASQQQNGLVDIDQKELKKLAKAFHFSTVVSLFIGIMVVLVPAISVSWIFMLYKFSINLIVKWIRQSKVIDVIAFIVLASFSIKYLYQNFMAFAIGIKALQSKNENPEQIESVQEMP